MNKLLNYFSKGLAFIYVFLRYKFIKRRNVNCNEVLIIMTGHLGNALMDINAVLEIKRILSKQDKKVNVLCSRRMWDTLGLLSDLKDIKFLDVDYVDEGDGTDFFTVRRIISNLSNFSFDKIIVTNVGMAPLANYIVATIPHNESIAVFDKKAYNNDIRWYFERAYTKKVSANMIEHETLRLKKIIEYLGGENYKIAIFHIPVLCSYSIPSEKYITIAIDSLSTSRRWPSQSFAELSNMLINEYGYKICFTGGKAGKAIYEEIIGNIEKQEYVINLVMSTSFKEWVELIRSAEFHIGVDSGSIHVAASVGTKVYCLSGVWDATRSMPYCTEESNNETEDPICIYANEAVNASCYGCKLLHGRMGDGNSKCKILCSSGEPCLCLSSIKPIDVMNRIRSNYSTQ